MEYVDNERYARKTDKTARAEYRKKQQHGCCGFLDVEEVCPIDGETYLIGCNHGH